MNSNISLEELSNCGSFMKIFQDKSKFCFGIDAILLADFSKNCRGRLICDLCTGNGIIPILLSEKLPESEIHGLEIQSELTELAQKSMELNNLTGRIKIIQGDVKNSWALLGKNKYDTVTVNPPYMKTNAQTKKNPKSIARQEILCNLEDIIKSASGLLKSNGKFYMTHRPSRLGEIFILLEKYNLGARRIRLVQPNAKERPTMVLVEAEKCARPELIVEETLSVYSEPFTYSDEVNEIYGRNAKKK